MLLIDNDIVHKLAQLDLLTELLELLKGSHSEIAVLATLRFKFCHPNPFKRAKLEKRFSSEVIQRIEVFIDSSVNEIDSKIDDEMLLKAMDSDSNGLDIGEMQLLQALLEGNDDCMFTGDKRFLKALSSNSYITEYILRINGSFVCFEQIIIFLIKELGFPKVKERYLNAIDSGLEIDRTLIFCFEGKEKAKLETVTDNLTTYIGYLVEDTHRLLSTNECWCSN